MSASGAFDPAAARAVVFDLYGTLLDVASLEPKAAAAGVREPQPFVALWRAKQLEYTFLRTLMGAYEDFSQVTGDALDFVIEQRKVTLHSIQRISLMNAWLALAPYEDTAAALEALAVRRLAVLSNGSPAMLEAALTHAGLAERFDGVYSVDRVRAYKPSPAVYEWACSELGLPAQQVLFVSANGFDAAGALNAGLGVAWLNRSGAARDRLGRAPDIEAPDLASLARLLAR
jgi:2-haloacid dehalogenase